jgi:hypothetical protein
LAILAISLGFLVGYSFTNCAIAAGVLVSFFIAALSSLDSNCQSAVGLRELLGARVLDQRKSECVVLGAGELVGGFGHATSSAG